MVDPRLAMNEAVTEILHRIYELRNYCREHDLLNDQMYLDFEDKLNEFSTLDPNK